MTRCDVQWAPEDGYRELQSLQRVVGDLAADVKSLLREVAELDTTVKSLEAENIARLEK